MAEGIIKVKVAFWARDGGHLSASLLLGTAFGGLPNGHSSCLRPRRVELTSTALAFVAQSGLRNMTMGCHHQLGSAHGGAHLLPY